MFFSLAILLVFGMVSMASAAQNVANTTQKGSLLIFPKIVVNDAFIDGVGATPRLGGQLGQQEPGYLDTWITIGNDYFQEVWVKCYWVDEAQNVEDFMFRLTPNQPIEFSAAMGTNYGMPEVTVPPFGANKGELKCWAVNAAGDQQISWNHLYGNALIVSEGVGANYGYVMYNAWSFTARGVTLGNAVGTGGDMKLSGLTGGYDACPLYLVTNFYPAYPGTTQESIDTITYEFTYTNPDLTLVPCQQDLRQDRIPTCTKAKFDIWNANETKYTGAYQCLKCWYEGYLGLISKATGGFGGEKFTYPALKTDIARFRVQSANNAACRSFFPECNAANSVLTPFLGLLLYAYDFVNVDPPPPPEISGTVFVAGIPPFGAGADGTGFVKWDAAGGTPEAPRK
jgi:hypothetical protein